HRFLARWRFVKVLQGFHRLEEEEKIRRNASHHLVSEGGRFQTRLFIGCEKFLSTLLEILHMAKLEPKAQDPDIPRFAYIEQFGFVAHVLAVNRVHGSGVGAEFTIARIERVHLGLKSRLFYFLVAFLNRSE